MKKLLICVNVTQGVLINLWLQFVFRCMKSSTDCTTFNEPDAQSLVQVSTQVVKRNLLSQSICVLLLKKIRFNLQCGTKEYVRVTWHFLIGGLVSQSLYNLYIYNLFFIFHRCILVSKEAKNLLRTVAVDDCVAMVTEAEIMGTMQMQAHTTKLSTMKCEL